MKSKAAYFLLIPATVFFLLLSVCPLIIVGRLSLFKTNYITSYFVGLYNYAKIFTDPDILMVIINSFIYAILMMLGALILNISTGLMVIDMRKWVHDVARFVFYIPVFTSGIIIGTVWRWILHPKAGILNWIIGLFGYDPVIWMGERFTSIFILSFMLVVTNGGAGLVIYLASMLSIPSTLFDSAKIDGATNMQIKLRIILPIITPTIFMMTLLGFIGAMQMFETIFIMRPIADANNLMYDIYRTGFTFSKYGLAAAKSLVLMTLVFGISIAKRRLERCA